MIKRIILVSAITLLLISSIVILANIWNSESNNQNNGLPVHPLINFDQQSFNKAVAETKDVSFSSDIYGGIIPHHLLPGYIIADFFSRLSKQEPKTLILIGPNHFEKGKSKILLGSYGWETPFGDVHTDLNTVNKIVALSETAEIDEDVVFKDHSLTGLMPFIKYYLPNVKVVPILLSGFLKVEETQVLAELISKLIDDKTVIICAVDFSHYLSSKKAESNDIVTLKLMDKLDFKSISKLNNDYVDSPPSIIFFLQTLKLLGFNNREVYYHTNSGELINDNTVETTSYFSIGYDKK
jgi:hypothetical protein